MRIGLTVFALLFLLESASSVYVRYVSEPQRERQVSEMAETKVSSPSSTVESSLPAKISPVPAKSAQQCINNGIELLDLKEFDMAIEEFDEAIQLNPGSAMAFYKRGWCWVWKFNNDKAIADFTQSIRLDPTNAKAYRERAMIWKLKSEHDRAIQDYDKAIRLDPSDSRAWSGRGNAWEEKHDYERALSDYDEAVRLNPEDGANYHSRGSLWESQNEWAKAIKDYERAIGQYSLKKDFFCLLLSAVSRPYYRNVQISDSRTGGVRLR
jgi:tetratricopeptide (TPR) repeat protein